MPLSALGGKRWSGYLSWRRRRRFAHRPEVLDALTAAVLAEDPVQILVTGDLVHIGLPGEIEAAARWLEALGPAERVMLVPGNHDAYAGDSWPAVADAWGPYLGGADGHEGFPVVRRLARNGVEVHLVGASSAQPTPLFMASGGLGRAQLEAVQGALEDVGGLRCLLIHHPPLPGMTSRRKGLRDAAALAKVLEDTGAELVLHGHVHRNVRRPAPGGGRIFGTASASHVEPGRSGDRGASYRVFELDTDGAGDAIRVTMRLMGVSAAGAVARLDEESWTVPVSRPARAASGAR